MMLRKMTKSLQKDQQQTSQLTISDSDSEPNCQYDVMLNTPKNSSIFSVPGLFVGLRPKVLSDCDSIRSPTSPLDSIFSNTDHTLRSPRSPKCGNYRKSWDCGKVGLGIVDSLGDDTKLAGEVLQSSESKNILFGPQIRISNAGCQMHINSFKAPKSLPKNYAIFPRALNKSPLQQNNSDVLFEIGEAPLDEPDSYRQIRACSWDSSRSLSTLSAMTERSRFFCSGNPSSETVTTQVCSPSRLIGGSPNSERSLNTNLSSIPLSIASGNGIIGSLSASEIERSEDYTCVRLHGPTPKTTHIYGDCILECHSNDLRNLVNDEEKRLAAQPVLDISTPYFSSEFLSFCYSCNKKLEEGKDIYIYRGEKAFCSLDCRSLEILIDEELEKLDNETCGNSFTPEDGEELFEPGIIITV